MAPSCICTVRTSSAESGTVISRRSGTKSAWIDRLTITPQQQAELLALLDKAVALRLNALVLQVRPGCDALYASKLEPWSEYLTGTMTDVNGGHRMQ